MNKDLHKKISERAYQLFIERGGKHGYHLRDWLKAEKEILGNKDPKKGKQFGKSVKKGEIKTTQKVRKRKTKIKSNEHGL